MCLFIICPIDLIVRFTEVRFKNDGLDSIEVQDNGSGIDPQNYESIGMTTERISHFKYNLIHVYNSSQALYVETCLLR